MASPSATSASNALLPSACALAKAPKPANQMFLVAAGVTSSGVCGVRGVRDELTMVQCSWRQCKPSPMK